MTRISKFPANFYVHQSSSGGGIEVIVPAYNGLIAQDPLDPTAEKIVPDLADRWEISSNGLTMTFFLHQGVKFSDGTLLTAADVKYNLDLVRNPPGDFPSPRKSDLAAIASVETPNDYTVVIKLSQISQSILAVLAAPQNVIAPKRVIEKDVLNALKQIMVGTGPYLFKKLTPESIAVFERNPNYWKPGLPYLDGIQVIPIGDNSSFMAALYTGQIDSASANGRVGLGKSNVQRVQKERPELLQGLASSTILDAFLLNTKIPPFTDQRVRQAVQDSIDKVVLMNTSNQLGPVGGLAIPGSFWALPTEELAKLPGYAKTADISARRAQARQLLKDAGIADGTEFTVSAKSDNSRQMEFGELIQNQLAEALPSLKVKIRNYAAAEFDRIYESFSLQTGVVGKTLPMGTDPDGLGPVFITGGSGNFTGISDPRIDELHAKQSVILDPAQRRLIVWERDKLIIQQGAWVPVSWRQEICLAWPYVKNQVCTVTNNGISARYEIVWMDK